MVVGFSDGLSKLIEGNQPRPRSAQTDTAAEGTIVDVGDATATFQVDGMPQHLFGPAPFGRTSTPPQSGDRCLIIFVGTGIDKAWIVRWHDPG